MTNDLSQQQIIITAFQTTDIRIFEKTEPF